MFLLIDNYDSFTYNLFHYFGELGVDMAVHRNDAIGVEEALALAPEAIVVSPGPCDPDRAGICLDLIHAAAGRVPILGVCLGHQAIGQAFGGQVVRAPIPMHGKISRISHDGEGLFAGVANPFEATRYHSLMVDPATFPRALIATAHSEDGVVQGLRHRELAICGVQFHPESIATAAGKAILTNFIRMARTADGRGNGPEGNSR